MRGTIPDHCTTKLYRALRLLHESVEPEGAIFLIKIRLPEAVII